MGEGDVGARDGCEPSELTHQCGILGMNHFAFFEGREIADILGTWHDTTRWSGLLREEFLHNLSGVHALV